MNNPFYHGRFAIPLWLGVGSVLPLGTALISQFVFGLFPCEMCIWQRYPYTAIVLLLVFVLVFRRPHIWRWVLLLAVALWLVEAGIATYHVGIEQSWWGGDSGCVAQSGGSNDLDDLRNMIMNSPLVSCSDVGAEFLGLSMAAWNILAALAFAGYGVYLFAKKRNE